MIALVAKSLNALQFIHSMSISLICSMVRQIKDLIETRQRLLLMLEPVMGGHLYTVVRATCRNCVMLCALIGLITDHSTQRIY